MTYVTTRRRRLCEKKNEFSIGDLSLADGAIEVILDT